LSTDAHLASPRIHRRQWRESDHAPFAAMNGDARVMEFFRNRRL
jgi:hypothetical protein